MELPLHPGLAIGAFQLGITLWDTLNYLRSSANQHGDSVSVIWDDEEPNTCNILLALASSTAPGTAAKAAGGDIRLLYSGVSQRLLAVEVVAPALRRVSYKGKALASRLDGDGADSLTPQRLLHARFGPTYPPSTHPTYPDEAVLSYPGVAFAYIKDPQPRQDTVNNRRDLLTRLLMTAHNPNEPNSLPFPDILSLEAKPGLPSIADGDVSHVKIALGQDDAPSSVTIHPHTSPAADQEDLDGLLNATEVLIGVSTSEDLLCELGPPLRTFWKEDNRLSAQTRTSESSSAQTSGSTASDNGYFYNYLSLGLDFLLHSTTNRVLKVVVHANTPGEVSFGRYAKCRWEISRRGLPDMQKVTSEDSLDKVEEFLAGSKNAASVASAPRQTPSDGGLSRGSRKEKALLLDRVADSGDGLTLDRTTELTAYSKVVVEVTQNKQIETLWII